MELGTYLELCEDRLKDAYIFLLALWHQDTCRGRRKEVSAYTANALRAIARIEDKMSEKTSTECAPSWRKLSDGLINLFYHRKSQRHYSDNFWGKHMCLIEESLAANRHVINLRLLRVCFERVLSEILHKSSDPVPAIRARVIKALSSFLSVDPDVLLREVVHGVVANKLKDRAISVREEAVKLVGSFIMSTAVTEASTSKLLTTGTRDEMPTKIVLSEYYLEDLKFCLHDEGISVRKSVVGLFKDILLSQPDHPQFMRLCLSLLEKLAHPKEEDSIKEIIRSTLQQIFFLPPSSEQLLVSFNRKHNSPRQLHMDSPADGANEGDEKHMQTTPRERKCEEHLQMSSAVTEVPGIMRTQSADIISSEFRSTPENNAVTLPSVDADNPRSTTLSRNKSSSEDDLLRHHVESTSLQLVEMACSTTQQPQHNIAFENSIHEWLINLLREVLHGTSEGEEMQRQAKQRRASCFHYCQRILDNLIEQLLRTEEQERVLVCLLEKKGLQPKDYVVNLIGTIALFCEAHPPFIAGHLTTLIPYLKRDTSHSLANNSYISLRVTEILCSVSVLKEVRIRFEMGEVLQDLSNIALNYGSKNTRSAIKCIALLTAHMGNDASYFFNLGSKCFAAIYDVMNGRAKFNNRGSKETFSPAEVGRLQRCLMVLCFLCEFSSICRNQLVDFASYFDVMRSDSSSILKATIEASAQPNIAVAELPLHQIPYLHPNVLHGSTYSAALCILSKAEDSNVQLQAVQALCGVFTGCPRLMILANEKNILPTLLGNTFESRVHERFLLALKDMLVNEEARSEKNAALNLMKESGVAVTSVRDGVLGNPEHDSDATIAGFQLQQHLAALLAFLGDKNASMRYTTLLLIGTLLRQGMLCPLDVIGELVALVADDVDDIREEALRMLQIEDEKHPNFLDNRITEGVERSFLQQCRIRLEENQFRPSSEDILQLATIDNLTFNSLLSTGGNDGGRSSQWVSRFGALYVTCIQPIKKRRNEFLFSLLRRCYQLFDFLIDEVCNHHSSYTSMQSKGNRNGRESDLEVSNENNQVRGSKRMKRLLPTKRSSAEAAQLMSEVPSAERNRNTAYFLCTTVAYLPFTSVEEPLQVIYFLNRNIPVATSLQLQQLKFQLISMGCEFRKEGSMQPPVLGTHPVMPAQSNESDKPVREIQEADILVNESAFRTWLSATADKDLSALYVQVCELVLKALKLRSLEALLRLKAFLKVGYQLSDDRCSAFNPDDKNSSVSGEASNEKLTGEDLPLFNAAPKTAPTLDEFFSDKFQTMLTKRGQENLSALQSALLGLVRSVCIDFNRISCLLVNDPEDFTYSGGNTTKRVRKASANRASTGSSNATRKGRSTKPHKKRKRFDMDSDDDDDLDDDDNYIGGGNGDEDYVAQTSRKAAKMDAAVRHGATSVASPQRRKAATAALSNVKRFMEEDGDVYERDIDGSGGAAANDIDADEDEDEGEGYF